MSGIDYNQFQNDIAKAFKANANDTSPEKSIARLSSNLAIAVGTQIKLNSSSPYVLPKATSSLLGGVKIGEGLSIDENGVVSASLPQNILLSTDISDWAKQPNKPSYNFSELNNRPTTLAGYGITETPWLGAYLLLSGGTLSGALNVNAKTTTKGLSITNGTQIVTLTVDENGRLSFDGDIYSSGEISAYGAGSTGGAGSGLITQVFSYSDLGQDFDDSNLTTTFNSYAINRINSRLVTVENKNYLSGLTSELITNALGFTPYNATNPLNFATASYVDQRFASLIGSAPASLDALNELANALGNDPNFAATVTNLIGTKQPQLNGLGFIKSNGTTISYDNSTYLATGVATATYLTKTDAVSLYLPLTGGNLSGALIVNAKTTTKGLTITNGTKSVNLVVDENGCLSVDRGLYSTDFLSAYGAGGGGGGGTGGLISNVLSYSDMIAASEGAFLDSDLTNTFNAYSIFKLKSRIESTEAGVASVVSLLDNKANSNHAHLINDIFNFPINVSYFNNDSAYLTANKLITFSGDVNTVAGNTSVALVLKNINSNVGSYGLNNAIPRITVNAKGLITAITQLPIGVLNQNTTGSAGSLLNSRLIFGQSFNGLADVRGVATVQGLAIKNTDGLIVNLTVDADGRLSIDKDVYSLGDVSGYGAGSTGGGGTGLVSQVFGYSNLGQTFNDSDLTNTFNAFTTNSIHNRLVSVENAGYITSSALPLRLSQLINDLGNYGGFVTGTPWTGLGYITASSLPTKLSQLLNDSNYATNLYVDQRFTDLIGGAPANLDTLKEISLELANDDNAMAALVVTITGKAPLIHTHLVSDITNFPALNFLPLTGGALSGALTVNAKTTTKGLTITNGTKSVNLIVDANGYLSIDNSIYSAGEISAYGVGSGSGGAGGGLIQTVYNISNLGGAFDNAVLTDTFNAYTINQINSRLVSVESGSATSVVISGSGNALTSISKTGNLITATLGSTFSLSTHNHSLNNLSEKSYNSLTDKPINLSQFNNNLGNYLGAVLTDQSTPQTIGSSSSRLGKLWGSDIDAFGKIKINSTWSPIGSLLEVSNGAYTYEFGAVEKLTTDNVMSFYANGGTGNIDWNSFGGFRLGTSKNQSLTFYTNDIDAVTINSSGIANFSNTPTIAGVSLDSKYIQNNTTSAQSGNIWISGNSKIGTFALFGDNTDLGDDGLTGFRIYPYVENGNVYLDTKIKSTSTLQFRIGAGVEAGGNKTWLKVNPNSGAATFASTVQTTGITPTNLTAGYIPMKGSGVLVDSPIRVFTPTKIGVGEIWLDGATGVSYGYNIYANANLGLTFQSGNTAANSILFRDDGNVGIGYSTGAEITNNKLAVNGSGLFNGGVTATSFNGSGAGLTGTASGLNVNYATGSNSANILTVTDTRGEDRQPTYYAGHAISTFFNNSIAGLSADWRSGINVAGWDAGSYNSWQLIGGSTTGAQGEWYLREGTASFGTVKRIWHDGNSNLSSVDWNANNLTVNGSVAFNSLVDTNLIKINGVGSVGATSAKIGTMDIYGGIWFNQPTPSLSNMSFLGGFGIVEFNCNSGDAMYFAENNSSRMLLKSGNLMIGSTSDNGARLQVTGNITATGEINAHSASDKRLKTNIKSIGNSLDIINLLNPVSYNWNDKAKELNSNKTDKKDVGLIAQELKEVLPELVHTIYNDEYLSVDYIKLIPYLIASIQELTEKIKKLESK